MLDRVEAATNLTDIAGVRIELIKRGTGRPLLLLHPAIGIKPTDRVIDRLARSFAVFAPSHPGFGRTALPRGIHHGRRSRLFLSRFDRDASISTAIVLVGIVVRRLAGGGDRDQGQSARIARLVLIDPSESELGEPRHRDIVDFFSTKQERARPARLSRSRRWRGVDHARCRTKTRYIISAIAKSAALFGWSPYMHNPKLASRLHRIQGADAGAVGRERPHRHRRITAALCQPDSGRYVRADRGGRALSAYRAAASVRRQDRRFRRSLTHARLSMTEATVSRRMEYRRRIAAREPAEPALRSGESRPTSTTAFSTNGRCATSSASTSSSTSTTRPRPA